MSVNKDSSEIVHVISIQPTDRRFFVLITVYNEADALNAVGQVGAADWSRDTDIKTILNTNDTLANMWVSPAENLWIGSSRGNVWTTASVNWPAADIDWLQFTQKDPNLSWHTAILPVLEKLGYEPNITSIWGVEDDCVFVGTFEGVVFQWNGFAWQQYDPGLGAGLNHIHGTAGDDVYCVGDDAAILHFDGDTWVRIFAPEEIEGSEVLTGVRAVAKNRVYICSRDGAILLGDANGFRLLKRCDASFYSVAWFNQQIILAGGSDGVWRLDGDSAEVIKDNAIPVGAFESRNVLFFVEANQENGPSFIKYEPASTSPWLRTTF